MAKNLQEIKDKSWTKGFVDQFKKTWETFVQSQKSQVTVGETKDSEGEPKDLSATEANLLGRLIIIKRRYLYWKVTSCKRLVEASPILSRLVRFPGTIQAFRKFIYYFQ